MTRILSDSEASKDASCSSDCSSERGSIGEVVENFNDDSIIDSVIFEEEERLIVENEKAESEEQVQNNKELPEKVEENGESDEGSDEKSAEESDGESEKELEAKIREKKYRMLMHLLNNSKMYSEILKDRIQQEEENIKKRNPRKGSLTKKETQTANYNKRYKKDNYKLGDVLTEKAIEESMNGSGEKVVEVESSEDYFEKTRVTPLGFTVSHKQPTLLEGAVLKDYQLKGLEWMIVLFKNGINGILADEMGLGKTIEVISFICYMIEEDIKGPFLIIAPLSTISNWVLEFKKFAPKVPVMLYHGVKENRYKLASEFLNFSKCMDKRIFKVIITSYQVVLRDKLAMGKINWHYMIIDEGHRIKNHQSLLAKTLRGFTSIGRLLLTGTPLQNDISELWSLLNFLLPEVFNKLEAFESWFDIKELESGGARFMEEKLNIDVVKALQEILMPFLLRREKKDVNLQLPPKKEVLIYCPLTPYQRELYEATIDGTIAKLVTPENDIINLNEPLPKRRCFLNSPYGNKTKVKPLKYVEKNSPQKQKERFSISIDLKNPQMQLRKIVNHPYLVQFPLMEGLEEYRIDEDLIKRSGKMLVLDALLAKLKAKGHKVVIFSYFKILLDILENHAIMRGYKYCRLDGSLNIVEREEEIRKFTTDPDMFIFYITIRAGGLGINLTIADTVIIYDSDWNPQINLQSQNRCHRIGQTKPVVVYRLCTAGTVDEQIIERGNAKRRLEKMILQKGKFMMNLKNPPKLDVSDMQALKELLSSTDHDTVVNSNGYVLSEEELEAILDRSAMIDKTPTKNEKDKKVFKVLGYEET